MIGRAGPRPWLVWAACCLCTQAWGGAAPSPAVPGMRRVANMPDGAPAIAVIDSSGHVVRRIECINNGWYDIDGMAARLLGSPVLMAAVVERDGAIRSEDLGPGKFDCVVVDAKLTAGGPENARP